MTSSRSKLPYGDPVRLLDNERGSESLMSLGEALDICEGWSSARVSIAAIAIGDGLNVPGLAAGTTRIKATRSLRSFFGAKRHKVRVSLWLQTSQETLAKNLNVASRDAYSRIRRCRHEQRDAPSAT